MSSVALRLTVVLPHAVQYYSPWFREINRRVAGLHLSVVYAAELTPEQQGTGFGRSLAWDIPLLDGYESRTVDAAEGSASMHRKAIGEAVIATAPDVVLLPGWQSPSLVETARVCVERRVPLLYRGDSNLNSAPRDLRRVVWGWHTRRRLRNFSGYLAVGTRSRQYLTHFGVPEECIFPSPHCVDNAFFSEMASASLTRAGRRATRQMLGATDEEFVVLFVGKFEPKKRLLDVVRAAARLPGPCRLIAVGSGSEAATARELATSLGAQVTWAGFRNQSELPAIYAAADCLALPSDGRETWGLVINEAMACGLPCVVSDQVGAAPDMIRRGETGDIFAMGDIEQLTGALANVRRLRGDVLVANQCRAMADRHSYASATSGLIDACAAVTKGRRGAGVVLRGGSTRVESGPQRDS